MAKTKFTPENRAVVLAQVRVGVPFAAAARDLDIREKTAEGWLTRGRREAAEGGDSDYVEFAKEIEVARAEHERAVLTPEEFEKYLSRAVRGGSVQAMKLWADLHLKKPTGGAGEEGGDGNQGSDDPFDALEGGGGQVVPLKRQAG